ncbi:phage tail family protein [Micromonospora sp. NPDC049240]|uniref:phage tail family protein n=1 Tax=Micromonospora sp. NPDC049240 TaxID=3155151 RepID=UPI0033CB916F
MPRLQLESGTDTLDLDEVLNTSEGFQALKGVTGFGMPEVSQQWSEGAGDGAVFRGERKRARDVDLPLYLRGRDREHLKELWSRLVRALSGECVLRFFEDDGTTNWYLKIRRTSGGGYVYGEDTTGELDLKTVVTVRAGNPYWISSEVSEETIRASTGRGILNGPLTALRMSASQAMGSITLTNPGDAASPPVWEVTGPGSNFQASLPTGESFLWAGTLADGRRLTIDTGAGTVVDDTGTNRYSALAPAPKLWRIPPGIATANVSMTGTSASSTIKVSWQARKTTVI